MLKSEGRQITGTLTATDVRQGVTVLRPFELRAYPPVYLNDVIELSGIATTES